MFIFGKFIYLEPVLRIYTFYQNELEEKFQQLEANKNNGFFVGYVSYEAFSYSHNESFMPIIPIFDFTLFKKKKKIKDFFKYHHIKHPIFYPNLLNNLNFNNYKQDFYKIKDELKKGNTYQVNYTQEIRFSTHCTGFEIFNNLLSIQDTKYKAYLKTEFIEIISFSPELFFKIKNNKITLQPMKGTIKRGKTTKEDNDNKHFLQNDPKNRSENMMIVDLLRNDISQIAKPTTLKVKKLLEVVTYPTLHQMISTLKAQILPCSLYSIFKAIFPCGSITGAPKKSTMRIIDNLEKRQRGVYCGAIGVISNKKSIFNVPIRTITSYNENFYRYGVGSGIVWDSKLCEEFEELKLKSIFLFKSAPDFSLVETMLLKNNKVFLLGRHLARLFKSADMLGFDSSKIKAHSNFAFKHESLKNNNLEYFLKVQPNNLYSFWDELPDYFLKFLKISTKSSIIRLFLNRNGDFSMTQLPFLDSINNKVIISSSLLHSNNDLLYHKTTFRKWFGSTNNKIFDTIFLNQKGEVCEGSRSNLVILKNDKLYTPHLKSGLLNGTFRELLLSSGIIKECILNKKDLFQAQKVFCINSVRGIVEVSLESDL